MTWPSIGWVQRGAAATTAAGVAYLADAKRWPFRTVPAKLPLHPTVWQYLFSDRYVLGVARLGVVAFAGYLIVSVPALFVAARWAKGFGTSIAADDAAATASKTLEDYEEETADLAAKLKEANDTVDTMRRQRNRALTILNSIAGPTRTTGAQTVNRPILREEGRTQDDAAGTED